jgi:carbon starvation protein
VFGGAVHDSVILFCSVRRGGKSLGQMVRDEVGPFAGLAALVSITAIRSSCSRCSASSS